MTKNYPLLDKYTVSGSTAYATGVKYYIVFSGVRPLKMFTDKDEIEIYILGLITFDGINLETLNVREFWS